MEKLENRNNVRLTNQIEILNILRKSHSTITDIADKLDISFTAAKNIIEEMSHAKLVSITEDKQQVNKRGRAPAIVKLNTENGIVCGIDMSGWDIKVFLCSLDCKILCKKEIPSVMFIEPEHLDQIKEIINDLLQQKAVKGKKLLSICISTPGLINEKTLKYEDVYRVPKYKEMDPIEYFKKAFNVKVEMYNDVRLSALAELKFGAFPSKPFNGIFMHIGTACGYALIINGKIYKGSNGFAGELATYNNIDVYSKTWAGRIYGIYDILRSEQKDLPFYTPDGDEKTIFNNLMKRYKEKDPLLLCKIEESIKMNAVTIIGLLASLDIEYLVIEGPILSFGKEYIETLTKYIHEYSTAKIRAKIIPSSLEEKTSIIGTAYQAVTSYYLDALKKLTIKRINKENFKINKVFYEI
ncbi:MAG: ROK family protein [bacterium]|nr:ROK family protein [bacterium]